MKGRGPDLTLPCWEWPVTNDQGYGVMERNGKMLRAHRVVYAATIMPIPDGLQLDHLCRNHACVNPFHVEPVTGAQNTRRGASTYEFNAMCRNGHPINGPEDLYITRTSRRCRACVKAARQRYEQRKKERRS